MKKGFGILLAGALALVIAFPASVPANAAVGDVSADGGGLVLSYSEESGVRISVTSKDFDPWETTSSEQIVRFTLSGTGSDITATVTNSLAANAAFVLGFVTDSETFCSETLYAEPGTSDIQCNAAELPGFTGEVKALEFRFSVFSASNIIVGDITYADGTKAWDCLQNDNWEIAEGSDSITATFVESGMLASNGFASGVWYPVYFEALADLSPYVGFSYYVDTTYDGRDVYFNKFFEETSGGQDHERWYSTDEGAAYFHPDAGRAFSGGANLVPANFKGRIYIPFSVFAIPDWCPPRNGVQDLGETYGRIGLTFDGGLGDVRFVIKDFRLEEEIEPVEARRDSFGDMAVFDDMSSYPDSDAVRVGWRTTWSLASPCDVTLVQNETETPGAGGNALRIIPQAAPLHPEPDTATGQTTATGYTALEYFPSAGLEDISGTRGLTFFIHNEESKPLLFGCEFDIMQSGIRQRWVLASQERYVLYDVVNDTQILMASMGSEIYIPADFCGWVRFEYSACVNPSWEHTPGDFTNETGLAYFVINIDTARFEGHSFVFDSFGAYMSEAQIATPFHTPAADIKGAIEGGNA